MLSVLYDGRWRDFEPCLYGRLRSGRDVLFGWQIGEAYTGWRLLYLHRLERFLVARQAFEAQRSGYELVRPAGLEATYAEITALLAADSQQVSPSAM